MILNKTQVDAVNHDEGPALILAVPGSGKTTVIIHRTKRLITDRDIHPDRVLSITFSKASAMDMKQRYITSFPRDSKIPTFSTIHAFCFRIIKDYSRKKNINFRLIEDESDSINKYKIIRDLYLQMFKSYITEEKLESFISLYGYSKNMMLLPDEVISKKNVDFENFSDFLNLYEDIKIKKKYLDFEDLLTLSHRLLVENPKALDYYRSKYDYIQLDEGQDTSKVQMEILALLSGHNNNLFIVADDDQSIYGFRGAYPQGLLDFKNTFPKGRIYYMENNYRSSKNIVNLSNDFIKLNKSRYKKTITTNNPYDKPVQFIRLKNHENQYRYISGKIREHYGDSHAVLFRNNLSAVGLMNYLDKNNITFYIRDSKLKFFNHWILNDLFLFFELSSDPSRVEIYEQVYYKMKGFVSKKMINWLKTRPIEKNVFKELMKYPGISDFYRKSLLQLELDFRRIQRQSPAQAIKYIREEIKYDDFLHENSLRLGYTYEHLKEMMFYLEAIAADTGNYLQLQSRLEYLKELAGKSSKKPSRITLSTVHAAKGLEFDHVHVIDLIDGSFPSAASSDALDKGDFSLYEEERRLFYVAMTRARKSLALFSFEELDSSKVDTSRFISELKLASENNMPNQE